jgi:4-aminobutyrate aminotransferase / (S)-3-amino-2-methylpropionate transaminase / 5-aminovalerate transaminase
MHINLLDIDAEFSSQGDTSARRSPKKIFRAARGEWLIDQQGRRYLDMQMCNSAANFGYGSPTHLEAVLDQAKILPALASEFIHADRVQLAQELSLATEARLGVKGRVHFSVGGAQAIDDALKLIGRLTGTTRVFAFEGSYHGRTLAASSISGSYRYRSGFGGVAGADFVPFPYCHRCPYGKEPSTCGYYCVSQFERLFDGEGPGQNDGGGAPECRAFIAEPVLGRGGYLPAPVGYFRELKEVLDAKGLLLVSDEVQMGFFRAGSLWSIEQYGVVPDIIVFGKAITNGMFPVSGLWAREPLMAPYNWPPGSSHATFAAAPIGTALGLATLQVCSSSNFALRAQEIGAKIEKICLNLAASHPCIRFVNRMGAAISLDIAGPSGEAAPELAREIVEDGLRGEVEIGGEHMGLVATAGGSKGNMIMLAPSLNMEDSSLPLLEALLRSLLSRMIE